MSGRPIDSTAVMDQRRAEKSSAEPDYSEDRPLHEKGGSLIVSIPAGFVKENDLEKGDEVTIGKYPELCTIEPASE